MPVFDPAVFDSGVFDTGVGMSATMSGSGALTGNLKPFIILLAALLTGSGAMAGSLATEILLSALLDGHGDIAGNLKVSRFMGRLRTCGDPLSTSTQDWILA